MTALANTRWELFCIGVVQGKTQKQAYRDAGFTETGDSAASGLIKRPEIKARIAELIEEKTQFSGKTLGGDGDLDAKGSLAYFETTGEIDKNWVIQQLMENMRLARDAGQFSAANKVLELLGKEAGMFLDKPKAPADAKKDKEQAAIPVDRVNAILDQLGYAGPPIDLVEAIKS